MKNLKEWQKVLLGVFFAMTLAYVADRSLGWVNEKIYYSSRYGIFRRNIYCLSESKDEILILGSSRAAHHYVPQVFEDSLCMSCFNCGSDGMCIYYNFAVLSSYIERGAIPKVVVCEVMGTDIQKSKGATFNLDAAIDRLKPHYGQYKSVDSLILLNGWKEKVKLLSHCYRYNSKLVQAFKCLFIPWPEDRGYEALSRSMAPDAIIQDKGYNDDEVELGKMECLKNMLDVCQENNIHLYFAVSPQFERSNSIGLDSIKAIASRRDIPFFDYRNDERFMRPEFFQDADHLNDLGAHLYSQEIVKVIKSHGN